MGHLTDDYDGLVKEPDIDLGYFLGDTTEDEDDEPLDDPFGPDLELEDLLGDDDADSGSDFAA